MAVVLRTRSEEIALGMTLLGLIFSLILYGISLSQTYTYYRRFPKDTLSTKLMVIVMTIIDAAAVALMAHACWYYFVTTGPFHRYVWSLNAELAFSMLISGLSEGFLASCALSGEVAAGQSLALHYRARFSSVKKRTGYKQTDKIIDRLMIFSMSTGLLTSFASVAGLITYLVVPKTWVYLALCFLISRSSDEAEESPAMPRFRSCVTPRTLIAREKPPTQAGYIHSD
ncbi:hypothetical protein IW261DRAFT_1150139 [Armillaria novae-zelandiae]|uniref:DUF6534 domain-containing protein n=1 Tax=Armillaria novae-zelandiae TaxID=153914 RepID=A0AA39PC40_9AGAR|nr:hypothetical protein IW261DRAFT_1150139 [Armillaria novae-zelandiae]